jgi:hypothetical protein
MIIQVEQTGCTSWGKVDVCMMELASSSKLSLPLAASRAADCLFFLQTADFAGAHIPTLAAHVFEDAAFVDALAKTFD